MPPQLAPMAFWPQLLAVPLQWMLWKFSTQISRPQPPLEYTWNSSKERSCHIIWCSYMCCLPDILSSPSPLVWVYQVCLAASPTIWWTALLLSLPQCSTHIATDQMIWPQIWSLNFGISWHGTLIDHLVLEHSICYGQCVNSTDVQ